MSATHTPPLPYLFSLACKRTKKYIHKVFFSNIVTILEVSEYSAAFVLFQICILERTYPLLWRVFYTCFLVKTIHGTSTFYMTRARLNILPVINPENF